MIFQFCKYVGDQKNGNHKLGNDIKYQGLRGSEYRMVAVLNYYLGYIILLKERIAEENISVLDKNIRCVTIIR
jgi:hypothetical protein